MAKTEQPAPAKMSSGAMALYAGAAMAKLDKVVDLLRKVADSLEQEPDLDTTWVVGGTFAAAAVMAIQIPKTIHHAEVTLQVSTSTPNVFAAVFADNVTVGDAGNRHNPAAGGSASNAVVVSNGGAVTARDNLNGVGFITVYFTGAATIYANVRIRSLDKTQYRARRT